MSTTYGVTQEFVQSQSIGLFGKRYVGYFNDDFDFFTADKEYDTGRVFLSIDNFSSSSNTYSWMWLGYFLPPTSGDYTFYTNSDGSSWMWVGEGAHRNTTVGNALVNNSGVHSLQEVSGTKYLRANKLYPVKILFGDNTSASEAITVSFSGPSISKTTDGRGYFFSGPYLFDSLYNTTTRTYPANGYEPDLVLDFENNYFRVKGEDTDFESALTHSRTSNATMVDSDGLIKWAPHNYFWDSTFTNFSNTTGRVASNEVFTSGDVSVGGRYQIFTAISLPSAGTYRFKVDVNIIVTPSDIRIAGVQSFTGGDSIIKTVNDIVDGSITIDFNVDASDLDGAVAFGIGTSNTSTGLAEFSNPRVYRIDLGGMVNNPDQTGSLVDYVPTTGSARYLARRGHHVYNGTEWVNEGVLIDETRTNLVPYSQEFDNTTQWSPQGVTTPSNTTDVYPDGTQTTVKTQENTSNSRHDYFSQQTLTFSAGVTYTLSGYYKPDGRDHVFLRIGTNGVFTGVRFLCTGSGSVVYEDTGFTGTIEKIENGWYRCSASMSYANATSGVYYGFRLSNGTTEVYTGDGVSGGFLYGAQIEEGSTLSSYIPTNGATATRAADSLSIPVANYPATNLNNSLQMECVTDFPATEGFATSQWLSANSSNRVVSGTDARMRIDWAAGTPRSEYTSRGTGLNTPINFACRFNTSSDEQQLAFSGTSATATTWGPASASTDPLDINDGEAASTVKLVRLWDDDIGTAGIEEASS